MKVKGGVIPYLQLQPLAQDAGSGSENVSLGLSGFAKKARRYLGGAKKGLNGRTPEGEEREYDQVHPLSISKSVLESNF